jgi:hypothetical protein
LRRQMSADAVAAASTIRTQEQMILLAIFIVQNAVLIFAVLRHSAYHC